MFSIPSLEIAGLHCAHKS